MTDVTGNAAPAARRLSFAEWEEQAAGRLKARQAERKAARTPEQVQVDEWAQRQLAASPRPPLSPSQRDVLAALFSGQSWNPQPERKPGPPRNGGRTVDPSPGTLYGAHLRASPGGCQRCRKDGPREVDHCHEHHVVRGPLCGDCNKVSEKSLGDDWRLNCPWCAWDIWLEKELAR